MPDFGRIIKPQLFNMLLWKMAPSAYGVTLHAYARFWSDYYTAIVQHVVVKNGSVQIWRHFWLLPDFGQIYSFTSVRICMSCIVLCFILWLSILFRQVVCLHGSWRLREIVRNSFSYGCSYSQRGVRLWMWLLWCLSCIGLHLSFLANGTFTLSGSLSIPKFFFQTVWVGLHC